MSVFSPALRQAARGLLHTCRAKSLTLATAESCTGGLLSALITEIPGASDVFTHGFITYANIAKQKLLGVDPRVLKKHGAVSADVVSAMAHGALKASKADLAVAITGIAGPAGGTKEKPVGLVFIAVARKGKKTIADKYCFKGTRTEIRMQAVTKALGLLNQCF